LGWRQLPRSWRVAFAGLFYALAAMVATALWTLRNGGPDLVAGHYFANSHGSLTPISLATFHHLQLAEQRLLSGVAGWFYLFGVLFNASRMRQASREVSPSRAEDAPPGPQLGGA
jgi:hypothetical protein